MMIVRALGPTLPENYIAEPQVHLGPFIEIDVATHEEVGDPPTERLHDRGGIAMPAWAPRPSFSVATVSPDQSEYEVRVYDEEQGRRLVAAVEIISPSNKDRPEHRRAFASKCASLLQSGVCVAIIDIVTIRNANLYAELMEQIGQPDPAFASSRPLMYAASCRWSMQGGAGRLEVWAHVLGLGQSLPTLPLWIADDLAIPLDLEQTYEETCRVLRIS